MDYDVNKDIVADTQVVVLMGGLGTRLGLKDLPKATACPPLFPCSTGRLFLDSQYP